MTGLLVTRAEFLAAQHIAPLEDDLNALIARVEGAGGEVVSIQYQAFGNGWNYPSTHAVLVICRLPAGGQP